MKTQISFLVLVSLFAAVTLAPAKTYKRAHEMPQNQFEVLAQGIDADAAKAENLYRKAAEILHLSGVPTGLFYSEIQETWNDSDDHSKGTHYSRHMTTEAKQWVENTLKPKLIDIGVLLSVDKSGQPHFLENTDDKAEIGFKQLADHAANQPVDSEPDDYVKPSENAAPDFNRLWGNLRLNDAIKAQLNDPDSYKFLDATEPVRDHVNGMDCWSAVVHFLAKNLLGATTRNYAYVSVIPDGHGFWQVIDCRLNP